MLRNETTQNSQDENNLLRSSQTYFRLDCSSIVVSAGGNPHAK